MWYGDKGTRSILVHLY
ncbi:hypothetical protein Gorai_014289 [Gossypium raimondii]|uniref:Uncharacterized protein n=1 Tax=Gossypium raimondii TaxID=29730 RepID=A0A7J8P3C2_GOSRA|nr:hypothetical protein [Gossypium raimondii]